MMTMKSSSLSLSLSRLLLVFVRLLQLLVLLLLLLLVATGVVVVDGKVTSGDFQLSGVRTEYLLGSYAVVPMGAVATVTCTSPQMYENEHRLKIHAYRDTPDWTKFNKGQTCAEKVRIVSQAQTHAVSFQYDAGIQRWKSNNTIFIYNTGHEGQMKNQGGSDRAHYWYFVIDDCSLEEYYQDNKIPKMHYEFTIQNFVSSSSSQQQRRNKKAPHNNQPLLATTPKQTHLSADQMNLIQGHTITMVLSFFVVAMLSYNAFVKVFTTTSSSSTAQHHHHHHTASSTVHVAVLWIIVAGVLDAMSSFFEIIHLQAYARNGIGIYTMDCFAAHCEAVCDAAITLFLLSIAAGWTLPDTVIHVPTTTTASSNPIQSLVYGMSKPVSSFVLQNRYSATAVMCWIVLILHIVLAQWGRTYDDEQESYHDFEHLPGKILMSIRVVMGFLYWIAIYQTIQACSYQHTKLKQFYYKMGIGGFVWFQSLPVLTLFCNWFVPSHVRLPTVFLGAAVVQSTSILFLSWLVTAQTESSIYHQYSHMTGSTENSLSELVSSTTTATTTSDTFNSSKTGSTSLWSVGKAKVRLD